MQSLYTLSLVKGKVIAAIFSILMQTDILNSSVGYKLAANYNALHHL